MVIFCFFLYSALQPKKHYVSVPSDITPDQVTRFMSRYWALHNPKIVLSVLSDVENFKPWKNQRLKDDFEKGIIKVQCILVYSQ